MYSSSAFGHQPTKDQYLLHTDSLGRADSYTLNSGYLGRADSIDSSHHFPGTSEDEGEYSPARRSAQLALHSSRGSQR